jgi:hypothetical protein
VCIAVQFPRYVWVKIKLNKYLFIISIVLLSQEAEQLAWLASLFLSFLIATATLITPPLLIATAMWAASWLTTNTLTKIRKYRNASILICALALLAMCSSADTTQHTRIIHPRPLPLTLLQFLRMRPHLDPPTHTRIITVNTTRRKHWHRLWPHLVTALKSSPILLLHPHQLVVPALSLLVNGLRILTYTGYKTVLTCYFGKWIFAIFVYLGMQ